MKFQTILRLHLIIILAFAFNHSSYSQSEFEGKIKMKITSDGETNYMNYFTKDKKYRMVMESGEGEAISIWDPQNKKMIMVMPEQKMYMEMPMDISKEMEKNEDDWKDDLKNMKFTNNTKTINGYECKQAIYNSEDGKVEIWYTSELGTFFSPGEGFGGEMPREIVEMTENGFFPMMIVTKDEDGEETMKMEVVEVEKMSLNSDMFQPPADFKKFEMPNMQDMLKNRKN